MWHLFDVVSQSQGELRAEGISSHCCICSPFKEPSQDRVSCAWLGDGVVGPQVHWGIIYSCVLLRPRSRLTARQRLRRQETDRREHHEVTRKPAEKERSQQVEVRDPRRKGSEMDVS
jgi:hypothetical protein